MLLVFDLCCFYDLRTKHKQGLRLKGAKEGRLLQETQKP